MANQTYRLVITGTAGGNFVQNIFHFRMDDALFANRLLAAKGLVDGFIDAERHVAFESMLPAEYVLRSIKARRVTNGGGPEYVDVSKAGETGQLGDDMQVAGSGPVIIWHTDGGPRRTGKTFLAGIGDDYVDGGEITNTALSALNLAAQEFLNTFNAVGGGTPVCTFVIPRSNDPSVRSLVIGRIVSKNLGQQRRRQLPV